jgi:hypothetical protein
MSGATSLFANYVIAKSWSRRCLLSTQSRQRMRGPAPGAPSAAGPLDLCALGPRQGIFNVDAEISHGALDLGVAKKDLHRFEVAGLFVDGR